jgi:hypothetical protein
MTKKIDLNFENNLHIIKSTTTKIKSYPSDSYKLPPIIKYIRNISPTNYRPKKESNNSKEDSNTINIEQDQEQILRKTYNRAHFDINRLTINNNTNLTNLNLYFLYGSEPTISKKLNPNNSKSYKKKEPKDSIMKKDFTESSNKPKVKNQKNFDDQKRVNKYKSIRYAIKKISSKSPKNNTSIMAKKRRFINEQKKKREKEKANLMNKTLNISIKEKEKEKIMIDNNKNKIKTKDYKTNKEKNVNMNNINSINFDINTVPKGKLNLEEFVKINQIGKGTFGKIFGVRWKNNGKKYALKKETFIDSEFLEKRKTIVGIINDFLDKTKSQGVIHIYSSLFEKNKKEYNYYELMELGERDWDEEIKIRRKKGLYYSEIELFNISNQLIKTLSLLQKHHITHRDIKPQNILIVNDKYKLCDFGEIRNMKGDGLVVQRIRGSELYMSPILFYGLRANLIQVKHNTYKSDVFSLGMCLLYAANMHYNGTDEIRELTDMDEIRIILEKYLSERYSNKFIELIHSMLQTDEQFRPDFEQLEIKLSNLLN